MTPHRTTARALLALLLLAVGAAPAYARPLQEGTTSKVPQLVFPVVGKAVYFDDFGAPRGQGSHQGNDIMTTWRSPAVAVESGKVKFHTTSARAGCMLYLYGDSGTTYTYIHLNNDLTAKNDNRGKCVAGTAYWRGLKNGARVVAGQPIAYNGNSGDADQAGYHLHFELQLAGRRTVSPFTYLRKAKKLLFAVQPGADFTAALRGSVVRSDPTELSVTMLVDRVQSWPGGLRVTDVRRQVRIAVSPDAVISNPIGAFVASAQLAALKRGQGAIAWTERSQATLEAALGAPLTLTAERLELLR